MASVKGSARTIGGLTAASRLLGFVRDMVIAAAFGTGIGAEAFVVSFKVPNLLRDLVGEGAANSAFVPVLTECRERQPAHFWRLVSSLLAAMSLVLAALAALGMVFAPQIVALIAPGFLDASDPGKYPLTIQLTRVIFPYIFLIGLSALAMGVLNTLGEFGSSALGPVLLNICMIIAGLFFEPYFGPMALVAGVLVGGVAQLACQIPPLLRAGFRWEWASQGFGYGRKIFKLLLPRAFGSALYQINVFVDSILASFEHWVGAGGQSALYYSNRLFQLPLAVFGVALAQALLPAFSTQMVRGDVAAFRAEFSRAVRWLLFISLPAAAGLMVWSGPIVRTLFERGEFDAYSTGITSSALFFYAFGLLSCCLIKVLVNAFYAMQDTRTPVRTMLFSVGLNVVLSLAFMPWLKLGGLALASSISATVNAAQLYLELRRRTGPMEEGPILSAFFKTLAAASGMALAAWFFGRAFLDPPADASGAPPWLALFAGIVGCILIYYGLCRLLRVEEARRIFR